jgi:hypothetical protein
MTDTLRELLRRIRDWWERLTRPRRTLRDVCLEIIAGLEDGSITVDPPMGLDEGEALPR